MRILRPVVAAMAVACALAVSAFPASAGILIEVDKSAQQMTVSQDGALLYTWLVSTGVRSHDTPSGAFTPFRMEKDHFSREWDDAPMPNSIFFTQRGHAIHGTEHIRNIGRPASHGCVRLQLQNARTLFALVKHEGMANTRVVLRGELPGAGAAPAVARRAPTYVAPGYDDNVTGSVPSRRQRVFQRAERPDPLYTGRGPVEFTTHIYDARGDLRYRLEPRAPFSRVFSDD